MPIASLGAFVLFLGFLAFNGGSELAIVGEKGHGQAVAMSFMNTIIGGAGGSVFALGLKYGVAIVKGFLNFFLYFLNIFQIICLGETPYWSLLTCINGGLAGMVAMCAGCNNLHPAAALGLGAIAGVTVWWISLILERFKIDDPLDAFAVHYGGGVVGVLMTPVFMMNGIVAFQGCGDQEAKYVADYPTADVANFSCDYFEFKVFAWNLVGLLVITLWAGSLSLGIFFALRVTNLLRFVIFLQRDLVVLTGL